MLEAALGFVLGVVGGCVLGATEEPVNASDYLRVPASACV